MEKRVALCCNNPVRLSAFVESVTVVQLKCKRLYLSSTVMSLGEEQVRLPAMEAQVTH